MIETKRDRAPYLSIIGMRLLRLLLLACILAVAVSFWAFNWGRHLELDSLQRTRALWQAYYAEHPARSVLAYVALYALLAGASIPGATLLTVAGGAAFGLTVGTVATSLASTVGATLAFLSSRYLLRDAMRARFRGLSSRVDEGMRKEGAFYLFALRVAPVFPFFVVNALTGLTSLRLRTYVWVSLIGMLPATVIYVNAGAELGDLRQAADLASPALIASLALLGLLPLGSRRLLALLRHGRALSGHRKPKRFDWDVVVIGAGSAGLVASYVARFLRARVALVERDRMGGDCLNTGCVPSKALIRAAHLVAELESARGLGLETSPSRPDFRRVMGRVQSAIDAVEPHDSAERYRALGVDVVLGDARVASPYRVDVQVGDDTRVLWTRSVIVATGASAIVPEIPGIDDVVLLTSESVWALDALPDRLLVVGGGAVGCELAQALARLGSRVTVIEAGRRLLAGEETEASREVALALERDGVTLRLTCRVERFFRRDGQQHAQVRHDGQRQADEIAFDAVLVAVGRRPSGEGLGLEELGVVVDPSGRVPTDAFVRTNVPTIYACGDVSGRVQLTHAAGHAGWYAAVNAVLRPLWKLRFDDRVMPRCTFTDPEVARVGLTTREADELGLRHDVTRYELSELDRGIVDGATAGFVQLLTAVGSDTILGVTIVSRHAGEMLGEWSLAMKHGLGARKVLATVHPYPTFGEANRAVAAAWAKQRAPTRALRWLEKLHAFRRR